jgi:DNA-binding NarL/FixJ family response regulator
MCADRGLNGDPLSMLSRREREVAIAIGRGDSTARIARRLQISVRTVESHVWHTYRKLDVHGRVELVRFLLRHQAIDLDSEADSVDAGD